MPKLTIQNRWNSGLLLAVVLGLFAFPLAAADHSEKDKTASSNPSHDASQYVGSDTCKTCHEGIYNAWEKTPHWKTTLNKEGGPSQQGCEGCHGPGA